MRENRKWGVISGRVTAAAAGETLGLLLLLLLLFLSLSFCLCVCGKYQNSSFFFCWFLAKLRFFFSFREMIDRKKAAGEIIQDLSKNKIATFVLQSSGFHDENLPGISPQT